MILANPVLLIGALALSGVVVAYVANPAALSNPEVWFILLGLGVGLLAFVAKWKTDLLKSTPVAVVISLLIAIAYFHIVDHYLMDMQGLDYWYLFRK